MGAALARGCVHDSVGHGPFLSSSRRVYQSPFLFQVVRSTGRYRKMMGGHSNMTADPQRKLACMGCLVRLQVTMSVW